MSIPQGKRPLSETHPELAKQWSSKNVLRADEVMAGSIKPYWWRGECGHEWKTSPNNRKSGRSCPYCGRKKVLEGFNDLATTHPALAKEWSSRNQQKPTEVLYGTNKKVWWVCKEGHEWEAVIKRRTVTGCPVCAKQREPSGLTALISKCPWVVPLYHEENPPLESLSMGSNRKINLVCENGHEWSPFVFNLSRREPGCPICRGSVPYSIIEKKVIDTLSNYVTIQPQYEVKYNDNRKRIITDGFFEYNGKKVIFEYDGEYWHQDTILKDTYKTRILLEQGYTVVRIREGELASIPLEHKCLMQINWEPTDPEALVGSILKIL